MARTLFLVAPLLVVACGSDVESGPSQGTAAVGSGGATVSTSVGDGVASSASSASTGAGGASATCVPSGSSTLPNVTIEFPPQDCTFSLAEAAAGIQIAYEVVVTTDTPGVVPAPSDAGGCTTPGQSGLITFEQLSGSGQSYCLCDVGFCPPSSTTPVTLAAGTYSAAFSWDGRNWSGPSDTGNPEGPPFPPGRYQFAVTARGALQTAGGDQAFLVEGDFPVVLVR